MSARLAEIIVCHAERLIPASRVDEKHAAHVSRGPRAVEGAEVLFWNPTLMANLLGWTMASRMPPQPTMGLFFETSRRVQMEALPARGWGLEQLRLFLNQAE